MRRLLRPRARPFADRGRTWQDVGALEDFPPETVRVVSLQGTPVAVFHTRDELLAVGDVCPHMGASLSEGALAGDAAVTCPAHALSFDLRTGACRQDGNYAARAFRTRVRSGRVFIVL